MSSCLVGDASAPLTRTNQWSPPQSSQTKDGGATARRLRRLPFLGHINRMHVLHGLTPWDDWLYIYQYIHIPIHTYIYIHIPIHTYIIIHIYTYTYTGYIYQTGFKHNFAELVNSCMEMSTSWTGAC